AWIQTTAPSGTIAARYEGVFYASADTALLLSVADGRLAAFIRDRDGVPLSFAGSRAVSDGAFHHVALVLDRDLAQARLYVDGTIDGTAPFTLGQVSDANQATTPLYIGAWELYSSQRANFFAGVIDELAIHDRA